MVQSYDTEYWFAHSEAGKYDATWSYWGFQRFSTIMQFVWISFDLVTHNATDDICKNKFAENLFYGLKFVCFTKRKIHLPMLLLWIVNQSRNHCNVCACYQPIGGGVFCMDAVWEWEDTNIRWHTEKYGSKIWKWEDRYKMKHRQIWVWEKTNMRMRR